MMDCLIIGGGVIGLSLARELARQGQQVQVIDRQEPGREASWAGAGMLPPALFREGDPPLDQLAGLSHALHPHWAAELLDETGVDTGFRRTGALYVARDDAGLTQLQADRHQWQRRGVRVEAIDRVALADIEPALATAEQPPLAACLLPDEHQLRNPRHVKALVASCQRLGVTITPGVAAEDFRVQQGRVQAVITVEGEIAAGAVCLAAGAWSGLVARRCGIELPVRPVRGQMVLFRAPRPVLRHIVNLGSRYLVPRDEGLILAGSTEEEAGFECHTTAEGIAGLVELARSLVPALREATVERTWAGLRPGNADGLPYLGRLPDLENAFVAAGHFRSGLHLSPGTAVVMSQLIVGQPPQIDLTPFRADRHERISAPSHV